MTCTCTIIESTICAVLQIHNLQEQCHCTCRFTSITKITPLATTIYTTTSTSARDLSLAQYQWCHCQATVAAGGGECTNLLGAAPEPCRGPQSLFSSSSRNLKPNGPCVHKELITFQVRKLDLMYTKQWNDKQKGMLIFFSSGRCFSCRLLGAGTACSETVGFTTGCSYFDRLG